MQKMVVGRHYCYKEKRNMLHVTWEFFRRHASEPAPPYVKLTFGFAFSFCENPLRFRIDTLFLYKQPV